jgi:hypothetical protein
MMQSHSLVTRLFLRSEDACLGRLDYTLHTSVGEVSYSARRKILLLLHLSAPSKVLREFSRKSKAINFLWRLPIQSWNGNKLFPGLLVSIVSELSPSSCHRIIAQWSSQNTLRFYSYVVKTSTLTNNFIYPATALANFCQIFINIAHYLPTELPSSFLSSGFPNKIL